jgi:23S rRNA pseudouridine1911/1915/1917 synthase
MNNTDQTLLEWAMRLCPDSPRKRVKEWINSGRFYLDGEVITQAGRRMPDPGEHLTLGQQDTSVASWLHRKRVHPKLSVLFLDASLAIVDKGFGLLSVPTDTQKGKSALEVLGDYLNDPKGDATRRQLFGSAAKATPLPVHRLDQYTSGLLCLALNPAARASLIDQLRRDAFLREYIAFCDGVPRDNEGTWRHYLRLDTSGLKQSIFTGPTPGAVEAVTHYKVEKVFARHRVSKLRIRLETGLKHQIRIQAAGMGLPLLGDRSYHPGTMKALKNRGAPLPYGCRRQALHAALIGIAHPADGRPLRFESQLPGDLAGLESRLA